MYISKFYAYAVVSVCCTSILHPIEHYQSQTFFKDPKKNIHTPPAQRTRNATRVSMSPPFIYIYIYTFVCWNMFRRMCNYICSNSHMRTFTYNPRRDVVLVYLGFFGRIENTRFSLWEFYRMSWIWYSMRCEYIDCICIYYIDI